MHYAGCLEELAGAQETTDPKCVNGTSAATPAAQPRFRRRERRWLGGGSRCHSDETIPMSHGSTSLWWPLWPFRKRSSSSNCNSLGKKATGSLNGPLSAPGLNLFRAENYSLFEVNAEAGMFERSLMATELSVTRCFKSIRKVLLKFCLVPKDMPRKLDKGWGHARRQSLGDLVRISSLRGHTVSWHIMHFRSAAQAAAISHSFSYV
jgi:hypothetical protein